MNALVENNYISEVECGSNFSYVLSDNSIFLSTEYKVLQSQGNRCFVRCMKMMYNGKTQLYYITNGLKPFATMIHSLDPENFLTIVANLLSDIIDVRHNGFLSCQNIDIAFEHIYVDPTTYKVSLVYLPISERLYEDASSFENEVRTGLVKIISGVSNISSPKTMQLSADLSNGILKIEDLLNRIKGGRGANVVAEPPVSKETYVESNVLHIIAMNAPTRVEIVVNKDSFVIGKKPELCDGVVNFNKMISRSHCRINKNGSQYSVTDLNSSNGTFVNNVRVQPDQQVPLSNGDVIRMANSDFQVSIKGGMNHG